MSELEKTSRGFNIYGRVPTHAGGSVRVQDSSLAFEGPHVWLFLDDEQCVEHLGQHMKPDPQLNVEQAKQLRDALNAFIAAAEGDELTEPLGAEPAIPAIRSKTNAELLTTVRKGTEPKATKELFGGTR